MNYRTTLFVLLVSLIRCPLALIAQTAPPSDLDAWIVRAMRQFKAPGVGLAIVKDGRVVLAKGYGARSVNGREPVDENTLFGIASNTKAFTATALAIVGDARKINWDDPVIRYLPGFEMSDPYVTREITVRDLLVHRSGLGLGEGDLMYFPHSTLTRDQIVHQVRFLPLATSFRSHYAYDNVLYVVAGQLLAAVTGKSWDDAIREIIFRPFGMTHSDTSVRELRPGMDYAIPAATVDGRLQSVEFENVDNIAAAGAINSCASDMAKWLLVQLGHGQTPEGLRLFSTKQSEQLWSGVTILPHPSEVPPGLKPLTPEFAEYALGFAIRDYHGRKLVTHSGGLRGYTSRVLMIPEEKLGVVVLTNSDVPEGHEAIAWHIVDHYLGLPTTDWISRFAAAVAEQQAQGQAAERKAEASRNRASRPSLPLSGYTGEYLDAWYGRASVSEENGHLVMRFSHTPGLTGELEHFQYDTFIAHWISKYTPAAYVIFQLDQEGKVDQIKMKAVSPLADFSYDYQDLLFKPVRP